MALKVMRILKNANNYQTTDNLDTDINDSDYMPFYDISTTTKKNSLWSNIKAKLKEYFDTLYAVTSHTHSKSDIRDFPSIPTVNNATLTIQKNGTTVKSFTANASSNVTCNITTPVVNSASFSGTTDAAGDLQLYNGSRQVFIVKVTSPSSGVIGLSPFIYDNRTFCAFINSSNHSIKSKTAVSGTYYYLS